MGLSTFIFFFSRHDFVRPISLEPLLAETPNSVCCLVLRSNFALLLTIQFAFFFLFFRQDFVRAISLELLLAETPNSVCCLVLRSNFALLLTIQFALFFLFFSATILSGPYLWNRYSQRLQIECAAWSCGLILHCCLPSNLLRHFFFFSPQFRPGHISGTVTRRDSKLRCCLVLRSNFALLLTIQFASLISSLINIISLLLTTFDWTKVRGIAPRSHTGRPRTCLVIVCYYYIHVSTTSIAWMV